MAQTHVTRTLNASTYTELTSAAITAEISFQNRGPGAMIIQWTVDTGTAPTSDVGSFGYAAGEGEIKKLIADIFMEATARRLWAKSTGDGDGTCKVSVHHA